MGMQIGPSMRGVVCKLASVVMFVAMQACIKATGSEVSAGQITFFRSAFGIAPILFYLAVLGELKGAWRTDNKLGHIRRGLIGILGMAFGFYGLTKLPMADAIAIGYSAPLITVLFAAAFLKEKVGIHRWTAVIIGIVGVSIISWPKLTMFDQGAIGFQQAAGAMAVIMGAVMSGLAMLQTRQLVRTEKSATIVLYLSLTGAAFALLTLPFGWAPIGWQERFFLIAAGIFGGLGQTFVTEAYRSAEVSTVAPFDYTSIFFGIVIAYLAFGEIPTPAMLLGAAVTVMAGIYIILRGTR